MYSGEVVSTVEQFARAMQSLKKGTIQLADARIETWRWDEPVAIMSWTTKDGLDRNIVVTIGQENTDIEANVWRDKRNNRCYVRLKIAAPPLSETGLRAHDLLEQAYNCVNLISTLDIAELPVQVQAP